MNGFSKRQIKYDLRIYQFTDDPEFHYRKWAGETPLLMTVPFLATWEGTPVKTDDRARAIATLLWNIAHFRREDMIPEAEHALGNQIGDFFKAVQTLPEDISGKLFRPYQNGIESRMLFSYSTQPVTSDLKDIPIAPALEVLKK